MDNKLLPGILLSALSLTCIVIVLAGLRKALAKTGWTNALQQKTWIITTAAISAWVILLGLLSNAGFFSSFTLPPRIVLFLLTAVIILLIISFTGKFIQLLKVIPSHWLVMMQSFRIIVELLLWMSFSRGLLPEQMTFEGRNFDILAGILGLAAGIILLRRPENTKKVLLVYNIIGLGLLLNIIIVAVLSFPGPTRYFMNEPANTIVAEFPFVYLPGILVVLAMALHIFSLRQIVIYKMKIEH